MPLRKGSSRKVQSANIREMVNTWKKTGKIGNSTPKSKKKAIQQAVAASYRQKRASSTRRKTRKK